VMLVNGLLKEKIEKRIEKLTRYLILSYSYLLAISVLADTSASCLPSAFNRSFS